MPSLDASLEGTVPLNCGPSGSPLAGGVSVCFVVLFLRLTDGASCALSILKSNIYSCVFWGGRVCVCFNMGELIHRGPVKHPLVFWVDFFSSCLDISWTAVVWNKWYDSLWVCCREKEKFAKISRTRAEILFSHFTLFRDYFIAHEKIHSTPKNDFFNTWEVAF